MRCTCGSTCPCHCSTHSSWVRSVCCLCFPRMASTFLPPPRHLLEFQVGDEWALFGNLDKSVNESLRLILRRCRLHTARLFATNRLVLLISYASPSPVGEFHRRGFSPTLPGKTTHSLLISPVPKNRGNSSPQAEPGRYARTISSQISLCTVRNECVIGPNQPHQYLFGNKDLFSWKWRESPGDISNHILV